MSDKTELLREVADELEHAANGFFAHSNSGEDVANVARGIAGRLRAAIAAPAQSDGKAVAVFDGYEDYGDRMRPLVTITGSVKAGDKLYASPPAHGDGKVFGYIKAYDLERLACHHHGFSAFVRVIGGHGWEPIYIAPPAQQAVDLSGLTTYERPRRGSNGGPPYEVEDFYAASDVRALLAASGKGVQDEPNIRAHVHLRHPGPSGRGGRQASGAGRCEQTSPHLVRRFGLVADVTPLGRNLSVALADRDGFPLAGFLLRGHGSCWSCGVRRTGHPAHGGRRDVGAHVYGAFSMSGLVDHLLAERTPLDLAKELAQQAKENAALRERVARQDIELFWLKTSPALADERSAFEMEFKQLGHPMTELRKGVSGAYIEASAQIGWKFWRARAALARETPP